MKNAPIRPHIVPMIIEAGRSSILLDLFSNLPNFKLAESLIERGAFSNREFKIESVKDDTEVHKKTRQSIINVQNVLG
jgi:hypothetical protein